MRYLLILTYIIVTGCGCASIDVDKTKERNSNKFYINKIEKKNNWYVIYAKRHDSLFKIISEQSNLSDCSIKIQNGNYYTLELKSQRQLIEESESGKKFISINYLDTPCTNLDEKTKICVEPENQNYDLYYSNNLKGLCYKKD